ncbi:MAG: UDP-glucose/GDP-mannose dehydrogenase family protein [Candidatus Limnocylindrales bacterium]
MTTTGLPQRVTVVGCGHVGLTMSVGLAELGHDVIGLDIDDALVERLRNGVAHIEEPGLDHYLRRGLESGRLSFSSSYADSVGEAAFIFLAVDTPQSLAGAADLRSIRSAMRGIVDNLNGTMPIIVNKSTSPIGTGETIEHLVSEALTNGHKPPRIVSNPEFLRQGRAIEDFFRPDRIVVGSHSREDAQRVADLYSSLGAPLIVTDLRTSEMIKYVANSFLATRISFINEIARLCEQIGADVDLVVEGVSQDERIGSHFFNAGIGFGGSCLPKDTAALRYIGESYGVATPLLSAVQEVNVAARTSAVRRLRSRLGTLESKRIGVWGLTFKGGTEDTRESPAIDVVELLLNEGAIIAAFDPSVVLDEWRVPRTLSGRLQASALDAVDGADAVAILTDWPEFTDVPLSEARQRMRGSVMFDGRNLIPRAQAEAAGFAYIGVGRVPTRHRRRATDR